MEDPHGVLRQLGSLGLITVTGKGGVGKSTVAAALGTLLARRGRNVLLIEVDPRESLHQLLGVEPSGGGVVEVSPRLRVQHLTPREVLDDLVREKLKIGVLVRKVLSSPIHRHFTEGAPGLKEAAVFGRSLRLLQGHVPRGMPRPDVVILDAPASGHGVAWMAAPQLVSDVIRSGPVGQMAAEVADFLKDADRFGVVVVTTAEEMPVSESLELIDQLDRRLGRAPHLVVTNAVYPPLPTSAAPQEDDLASRLWRRRRELNDRELERLGRRWSGPHVELPMLPVDPGPGLVGHLGRRLAEAL